MKRKDIDRVVKSIIIKIVGITGTLPVVESREVESDGKKYLHINLGIKIDD